MHNDPANCVDLWGLTASDSTANKFHIGQNSSGASFVDSMITDPDYALYLSDQEKMAEIKKRYNSTVKENSGFYENHSACDEYITELLTSSSLIPKDWPNPLQAVIGPSNKNSDTNYIDTYKETLTDVPKPGTSVAFMEGGDLYPEQPHGVYIFRDLDGSISVSEFRRIDSNGDGKINNADVDETGNLSRGIVNSSYTNQTAFEDEYGYTNYYYLGVDTL